MIKLQINAAKYDLDDTLKSRIEDRIGGLDEFLDTLDSGEVTLTWDGGPNEQTKVHARVWGPGNVFDGSDTDWKPDTAVDQTRKKLEAQIRKVHDKAEDERDHRR